jgi:hypothetical protein
LRVSLNDLNAIMGIIGALAGVGSLYYAWRNDAFTRLLPKDPKLEQAFSGNENDASFIGKVHAALQQRVRTSRQLRQAYVIAKQMHFAKPMDKALAEVNNRAIELGDLTFAYKVATSAHFAVALDEMLTNIVDASLSQGNTKLANKCANRMHFAMSKDNAKKKILNRLGLPVT